MPAGLHVTVRHEDGTAVVAVSGRLDPRHVPEVEEVVRRSQRVAGERLVLDLTEAEVSLDTSALVCRLAAGSDSCAGFEVRVRPSRTPDRASLSLTGPGG